MYLLYNSCVVKYDGAFDKCGILGVYRVYMLYNSCVVKYINNTGHMVLSIAEHQY